MSVCNPCTKANIIPVCTTNIEIGKISDVSTDVYVYIKNITTGRLLEFETTSDINGLVTLDISEQEFMPNHSYELWVTLKTATSIEDKLPITIDTTEYNCFALRFDYLLGSNNIKVTKLLQTLSVA